jgi:hypothetical protein
VSHWCLFFPDFFPWFPPNQLWQPLLCNALQHSEELYKSSRIVTCDENHACTWTGVLLGFVVSYWEKNSYSEYPHFVSTDTARAPIRRVNISLSRSTVSMFTLKGKMRKATSHEQIFMCQVQKYQKFTKWYHDGDSNSWTRPTAKGRWKGSATRRNVEVRCLGIRIITLKLTLITKLIPVLPTRWESRLNVIERRFVSSMWRHRNTS